MMPLQSLHPDIIKAILQTNLQLNNIVHFQYYEDKTTYRRKTYFQQQIQMIKRRILEYYENDIYKTSYFEKYRLFYPHKYQHQLSLNSFDKYESSINLSKTIKNFIKSISYRYITQFMYLIKKNISTYDYNLEIATYSTNISIEENCIYYIIVLYINSYCFRNDVIRFDFISGKELYEFHNYKQMLYLLYKNQPIKSYIIK